jgi:hypothetical protein
VAVSKNGNEFSQMKLYLEAFVDSATATKASEGWGGDRYVFYEDANKGDLLVLRSTWDTPQDAQEFFDAYLAFEGLHQSYLQ